MGQCRSAAAVRLIADQKLQLESRAVQIGVGRYGAARLDIEHGERARLTQQHRAKNHLRPGVLGRVMAREVLVIRVRACP